MVRRRPADTPLTDLCEEPETIADVGKAVDYADQALSRAESIREFRLVAGELTGENGLLTPSLKVGRHAGAEAHEAEIEARYR
ncbi:hypothetical protein [Streptomyces sp. NPDC019507]|uniref:hypothetical protein n=1 Tax=Streptomyces sp. NPDC019507 TaxID=3154689 RepID=UPI0033F52638